ncbi:MAG: hypothetical protein KJ063_04045 [Anaerolineae bacterium]|nr:hypothetical protein [Anaerolineae bacterium]
MFVEQQLHELLDFSANGNRVLSLYVDTDLRHQPVETIKLQVRSLLREAKGTNQEDVERIESYFDTTYDWKQPGIALFSCLKQGFFKAYPVAVSFRNRIRLGTTPYVKPLAHFVEHYAHYGVILVDKVGARFFDFHLGELVGEGMYEGEAVRGLKRGHGSSATGMRGGQGGGRQEEETILRNIREIANHAERFFRSNKIRRLFLGGTQENIALLREYLPKQMQTFVAGTFTLDIDANEAEVNEQALQRLREVNNAREEQLVQMMITAAAKAGQAVVGLDDTLQAVSQGRVQHLVVSDGYRQPGYRYDATQFVTVNLALSPYPEHDLQPVDDVIDAAVTYTMAHGGRVEVISDNPALDKVGHIGAILRY